MRRAGAGAKEGARTGLRRVAGPALALLLLLVGGRTGAQGLHATPALPEGLSISVEEQLRWEVWRFFDPAPPGGDPDYDFVGSRTRLSVRHAWRRLTLDAAVQGVQLLSLPDDAVGLPGGALGTGALYFAHAGERTPEAVQLRTLSATLRPFPERALALTLGRFGYASGGEHDSGIPALEALKKRRIQDRLVGEFGWSFYQRSFDGAWLRWDEGPLRASLAAFSPTEGGFEDGGTRRIDAIDVVAAALTLAPGPLLPRTELQAFYLLYDDERRVRARVDNTGLPAPDRQDLAIHTFGGHAVGIWSVGPGELDLLAWGALQTGRWFELDHRAAAGALEAGYRMPSWPGAPWLRVGAFRSTGDGAPGDARHETFFQVLPTARRYALTPFYNLMNLNDLFVELRLAPRPGVELRAAVRDLRLASTRDLWYAGAGATRNQGTLFGYAGRPSLGGRRLGTATELGLAWRAASWAHLDLYYGHVFGGDVVEHHFRDDRDLDFFGLELTFRFGVTGARAEAAEGVGAARHRDEPRGGAPTRRWDSSWGSPPPSCCEEAPARARSAKGLSAAPPAPAPRGRGGRGPPPRGSRARPRPPRVAGPPERARPRARCSGRSSG